MAKDDTAILLGRRIKSLRKEKHLTQEELGARSGIHYKYIGAIERGEENPSLSILHKVSEALRVEIIDLFRFQHEESNPGKLRKMMIDEIKTIEDKDLDKLQLIIRIIKALK